MRALVISLLTLGAVVACGDGGAEPRAQDGGSDERRAADADAEDDGSTPDAPFRCPDPEDPLVHYQTRDVDECPIETLVCADEQRGFHNACGCGCIDRGDPACSLPDEVGVNFISPDPSRCVDVVPDCPLGQKAFHNLCGCGCVEE